MRSVAKQAIAPGFSFLLALFILVAFNIVFQSPPKNLSGGMANDEIRR